MILNSTRSRRLLWALLCLLPFMAPAQGYKPNSQILFQKLIGAQAFDVGKVMIPLADGTYFLAGSTTSNEGIAKGNHGTGTYDFLVVKASANGYPIWSRVYGGSLKEELSSAYPTPDGGFILMGTTDSKDGDVKGNHGKMDMWLVKIDRLGNLQWSRCYGGGGNDRGFSVTALSDGGYIIGGEGGSADGDVGGTKGGLDGWVAKLDAQGNILVKKNIGGRQSDKVTHLLELSKQRYLVVGETASADGDITRAYGQRDVMITLLSKNFDVIWQRNYGGSQDDEPHNVFMNKQHEIVVVGTTFSEDEDLDLTDYHGLGDAWAFLITDRGNLAWSECYGVARSEGFNGVTQTEDGGYLFVGTANSYQDPDPRVQRMYDGYVVRADSMGNLKWSTYLGGELFESIFDAQYLGGGRYQLLGFAESQKYDLSPLSKPDDASDFWFLRVGDPGVKDLNVDTKPYIAGRVTNKDDSTAITTAEVVITSNTTLLEVARAATKDNGYYTKELPSKGKMSVNISAKGYMFYGQDLPVTEDGNPEVRVDVVLEPIRKGSKVTLNLIYFETGDWKLTPDSDPELMRLKMFLKANPNVKVEISGHTDNTGNAATKMELSQRRAESVRDWLLKSGVPGRQMTVKGYGMERPVADNSTTEGQARNRRVEVEVVEILTPGGGQ